MVILKNGFFIIFVGVVFLNFGCGYGIENEVSRLKESSYVTIVITVSESDADTVREAMGTAGAG